jgi:hypothetical protein
MDVSLGLVSVLLFLSVFVVIMALAEVIVPYSPLRRWLRTRNCRAGRHRLHPDAPHTRELTRCLACREYRPNPNYIPRPPAQAQFAVDDDILRAQILEFADEYATVGTDKIARMRAKALLYENLTEDQARWLNERSYFAVRGSETRRIYYLTPLRISYNVLSDDGIVHCAYPRMYDDYNGFFGHTPLPIYDVLLAQKLLIESNEAEFRRKSNKEVCLSVSHHPAFDKMQEHRMLRDPLDPY